LIQNAGLKLRDVENRMYPVEIIGKRDMNGVPTNVVDNLEGTDVSFRKRP